MQSHASDASLWGRLLMIAHYMFPLQSTSTWLCAFTCEADACCTCTGSLLAGLTLRGARLGFGSKRLRSAARCRSEQRNSLMCLYEWLTGLSFTATLRPARSSSLSLYSFLALGHHLIFLDRSHSQEHIPGYVTADAVRVCNACMQTDTQTCAEFLRFRSHRTVTRTGADRNACNIDI